MSFIGMCQTLYLMPWVQRQKCLQASAALEAALNDAVKGTPCSLDPNARREYQHPRLLAHTPQLDLHNQDWTDGRRLYYLIVF